MQLHCATTKSVLVLVTHTTHQPATPRSKFGLVERFREAICQLMTRRHIAHTNDQVIDHVANVVNRISEVLGACSDTQATHSLPVDWRLGRRRRQLEAAGGWESRPKAGTGVD